MSEQECASFLQNIDANGDAMIQINELDVFITKGIAMTDDERTVYKSRGRLHLIILEFFDACKDRIKHLQ